MKPRWRIVLPLLVALAAASAPAHAADPSANEIVKRSLDAFYFAGNDMRARVQMKLVNPEGQVRERDMTMLRINVGASGEQRYYMYFHGPADVKGTSFLVWKYPNRDSDRWIYIPALHLVKRIAADDKRSSFVGSDFTYEDVSGRNVGDENHVFLRKEEFGGRPTYVIESKPKTVVDYSRRLSWIDQERWLPLKEEYYDAGNKLLRVFTADKVEQVGKYWTVTARTMKNVQSGYHTEVVFQQVQYDIGLKPDIFTERYLRNPPTQWVR